MGDTAELAILLESLNVRSLGSGNSVVGVNLLAGMACTLANLAPDDGSVIHPDGSPARLGTSLLVMGSESTGRVVDEIISEINRRQNNLSSNLQSYFDWVKGIKEKQSVPLYSPSPGMGTSVELIAETQSEFGDISKGHAGSWGKVLERVPVQTINQIGKQPKFLVSVGGRMSIESQMTRLRPGCPLVHLGLSKPDELLRFSEVGAALLEGRYPLEDGTLTVKGNILITDPMQMLMATAQTSDERINWLGQLLWLSDGDSGPDAPPAEIGISPSAVGVEQRFREALGRMMIHRFNLPNQCNHWFSSLTSVKRLSDGQVSFGTWNRDCPGSPVRLGTC